MIQSHEEAQKLASNLSHNLYYDTDFTHETFRVFLDSLPSIFRVFIQVSFDVDSDIKGIANIQFYESKKSIGIFFHTPWIFKVYFRSLRKVPFTLNAYYLNFNDNVLPPF